MARLVVKTKDMARDEWLTYRKQGIGGSDAAAVAGVSKYANPLTLYMEKRGLYTRPQNPVLAEAAHWGNVMEPVLRAEFKRRINEEREAQGLPPLWVQQRHALFAHDEHDFMRTNLDGQIMGHELGTGILEIKTSSEYLKDEWEGDDVPNQYYLQVQHNIKVMEAAFAYLVVLIGGNKYKHYFIERDDETIGALVAIEHDFWHNNVLAATPPVMDGMNTEKEMLNALYPQSVGDMDGPPINLPNVCIEYVERIDALKKLSDCIGQEQTRLENEVKAIMGDTETAFAGKHKITWKTNKNGARAFKILLDAEAHKNKYYDEKKKGLDKHLKEIEKEAKEAAKQIKAADKTRLKAIKEAEKMAKDALKAAKAELKELQGQQEEPPALNQLIAHQLELKIQEVL